MNILPKKYSQFKDKQYWNNFFSQLKNTDDEFFQWYGNYQDFKDQLKKIFKNLVHRNQDQQLKIFHIGCGKSTFGEDIQLNYPKYTVINTDYSEEIVKDMIKRSLMLKTMCKYEVCDMFEPLPQKYQGKFDIVLDKGTLDAILPEDSAEEIKKIKEKFFTNVQNSFNKNHECSYLIISMLQPFVLRTVLQQFGFRKGFNVQIQESRIKDSKMQPFLVNIRKMQTNKVQEKQQGQVIMKLRNGSEQKFFSIPSVMQRVHQLQETIASQGQIKILKRNQHNTYQLNNPQNPAQIRYTIQIIDHFLLQKLKQNSCAVFIVPQGKQNSSLFSTHKGLQRLIKQVNTSRLIVVRLMIGNTFKSIQQVKNELSAVIGTFVQAKCDVKAVPFMTDMQQLGVRKYAFQDQNVFIEEIQGNEGEAYRRVILKNNLEVIQSQYKLIQTKLTPQKYAYHLDRHYKSTIFKQKNNHFVLIDSDYLDQGYARWIFSGVLRFFNKTVEKSRILVLGGGGYCLPKFIYEQFQKRPHIQTIQIQKSLCSEHALSLFEIQEHIKNQNFKITNTDAYQLMLKREVKEAFDVIIVDVSGASEEALPPAKFLSKEFISQCYDGLNDGGILTFNVIKKGFLEKDLVQILGWKLFEIAYLAGQILQPVELGQELFDDQDSEAMVLFLVKNPSSKPNQCGKVVLHANQMKSSSLEFSQQDKKSLKRFDFIEQCLQSTSMIYPLNTAEKRVNIPTQILLAVQIEKSTEIGTGKKGKKKGQ